MNSTSQCHQLCPYPCHQHRAIHPGQESIPGLVNHDWMIDWHKFRVRHCNWLVANVTKNWALATRNLELVASRRLTFFPLGIWNSKVNGLFFKRKHKAAVDNCCKTKRRSYDHHIYPAPYCFSGFSQFGYRGRKRDVAKIVTSRDK